MYRHPLLALAVILVLCAVLAWGLPVGVGALKQFLSPSDQSDETDPTGQPGTSLTPAEQLRNTRDPPDFPSN